MTGLSRPKAGYSLGRVLNECGSVVKISSKDALRNDSMFCSASSWNRPSSPILRTSLPSSRSPSKSMPKSTPASRRMCASLRDSTWSRSSKDAKSPTNHRYRTGSLRASFTPKPSSRVHRARIRLDLPNELPCWASPWSTCWTAGSI